MKKTIKILSIVAIVLSALSILWATALLFAFWKPICASFHNVPEVIAAGPILPIGNTVYMVGGTALAVAVYICSKSSKSIAGEIVSILLLSIVLPIVTSQLSLAQTKAIASGFEAYSSVALSIANNISGWARSFMDLAAALCYVVCGMSIAEKTNTKKSKVCATE